jgi:hypothetical protein
MKKIRLEIGNLEVESFATGDEGGPSAGTVRGHYTGFRGEVCTSPGDCPSVQTGNEGCPGCAVSGNLSCVGCPSDTASCGESCGATDGGSICLYPC